MQNLEVDIPTELFNQFRLASEKHGISVNELICDVLQQFVDKTDSETAQ
jgi:predicted HicB family RNase H-like nuclease